MKKSIAIIIVLTLSVSMLAACGGGGSSGSSSGNAPAPASSPSPATSPSPPPPPANIDKDGSEFRIDFTSTEMQPMSDERASKDKILEVVWDWLDGGTMFIVDMHDEAELTYGDFVEFIGVDASEYNFDSLSNRRVYTWIAEESDASKFAIWVDDRDGTWSLAASGAANLMR